MGKPLRLPSRHVVAKGILADFLGELQRVLALDVLLVVGHDRRAIRTRLAQVGTGPVEDRHEVVADQVDALFTQRLESLDVILNVLVTGRQADLDVVVDVDALNPVKGKVLRLDFRFQRMNPLPGPHFARGNVIQGRDDSLHVANLADLVQRDGISLVAVPPKRHFHGGSSV